jgi:hypothetical protein
MAAGKECSPGQIDKTMTMMTTIMKTTKKQKKRKETIKKFRMRSTMKRKNRTTT